MSEYFLCSQASVSAELSFWLIWVTSRCYERHSSLDLSVLFLVIRHFMDVCGFQRVYMRVCPCFYMHVFVGEFLNEGESACLCEWVGLFSCVCVNACVCWKESEEVGERRQRNCLRCQFWGEHEKAFLIQATWFSSLFSCLTSLLHQLEKSWMHSIEPIDGATFIIIGW